MKLDARLHPPFRSSIKFPGAIVTCPDNRTFEGELELGFRSFLPDEPLLCLERVVLHVTRGLRSVAWPRDLHGHHSVATTSSDISAQFRIAPFSSVISSGMPVTGGMLSPTVELVPLPVVELESLQAPVGGLNTIWGYGLDVEDLLFSHSMLQTSADGRSSTAIRNYPINWQNVDATLSIVPGESDEVSILARAIRRDHSVPEDAEPEWLEYPDNAIRWTGALADTFDPVFQEHVLFSALMDALLGTRSGMVSAFFRSSARRFFRRYQLFKSESREHRKTFGIIPVGRGGGESLVHALTDCWPRVMELKRREFNLVPVAGWLKRGRVFNPIEQGFINMFTFLEALGFNWWKLTTGRAPSKNTSLESKANKALNALLGTRRRGWVDQFLAARDELVHQGSMDSVADDRFGQMLNDLSNLCSASFLSLVGWTRSYLAFSDNALVPRAASWQPPAI